MLVIVNKVIGAREDIIHALVTVNYPKEIFQALASVRSCQKSKDLLDFLLSKEGTELFLLFAVKGSLSFRPPAQRAIVLSKCLQHNWLQ